MEQNKGLDKNQLISFFVMSMILMGFLFYFQNRDQKNEVDPKSKTEQKAKTVNPTLATNINQNVAADALTKVSLKNEELNLEFSSLGGQISTVELLKYKAYFYIAYFC